MRTTCRGNPRASTGFAGQRLFSGPGSDPVTMAIPVPVVRMIIELHSGSGVLRREQGAQIDHRVTGSPSPLQEVLPQTDRIDWKLRAFGVVKLVPIPIEQENMALRRKMGDFGKHLEEAVYGPPDFWLAIVTPRRFG